MTMNNTNNMSLREQHHSSSSLMPNRESESESDSNDSTVTKSPSLPSILVNNDMFWEHEELLSLISKERLTHFSSTTHHGTLLEGPRFDAVLWISKVSVHYGFTALTTVLAVNYFDRFITSLRFQRVKPWMTHLTAVASLSLAAKMEETQVPLLLGLQVGEPRFVFEAKTIQRMELLMLSTLEWRMNPVTPISFFEHIVRRLGLKSRLHWEFLWRCQRILLSVIADSRVMSFLPSTLAAATMIHVIKEIEPFNAMEYITQLMALFKTTEEKVNECYKLILKLLFCYKGIQNLSQKRKCLSGPRNSGAVMDAPFSCDSSNDSWTVASSISLEQVFKRSKAQDQHMRLPSVNRVSIDVLNSPH